MAIKILLADDSLTIQKVVELTFSDAQTRLMAVGSGDRAVQALDDFAPDIVLADVVMPGLTGYDVCDAVKQRPGGAFIPVVLLTGTFEPFDRARAERVGSDAIVTKPFDSHALQGLVRELVGKARAVREEAEAAAALAPPPVPEPPPTTILSAADLEGAFPPPAKSLQDTGATQAMPALDLGVAYLPPFVSSVPVEPVEESSYSTRAMKIPTAEELALAADQEGLVPPPPPAFFAPEPAAAQEPPSPFEIEEVATEPPPPPFLVEPAFVPPPPPPPPAFFEPEPVLEGEPVPPLFDAETEPAAEPLSPFFVEPAVATEPPAPPAIAEPEPEPEYVPPPPPPAFFEAEPAYVPPPPPAPLTSYQPYLPEPAFVPPPPPPPPAFFEPEPVPEVEAPVPSLPATGTGPDTEPLVLPEVVPEPFFAEAEPEAPVEAAPVPQAQEAPFELGPEPESAPASDEIEVDFEPEPEPEPAADAVAEAAAVELPVEVAAVVSEAAPAEPETVEPFPEMDQPVPDEESAPWDEGPAIEVPPPPPELGGGSSDVDGVDPIPRDIEADLEAFEASGRVRRRPEIWERHAALIGEETPADIDLHGTASQETAPPEAPEALPDELEEIAAAARLEDLSKLIPPPSVSMQAPVAQEAAAPAATTAPIAAGASGALSEADVDRIARRVVQLLTDKAVRDIAWEVVPDYAERLVRERIAEVERAG